MLKRINKIQGDIFDVLGRIAFPIFIFLLVEGYFHTRNKWKYLGTLLIFGVISEVPFDMFSSGVFFEWDANNIMFTLSLVLVMIWIIDNLRTKMKKAAGSGMVYSNDSNSRCHVLYIDESCS